jgi:peptidoglycan/LPS O-acetylase OafA/YrhL
MTKANQATPSAAFADSKPHYALLDALRGAAALMVVWYHFFEGFAFAEGTAITTFNHGHLGVDLFFMLSGFVISYAYDDRWTNSHNRLTLKEFFKRRLIRLHPMLIMGAVIGLITFCLQGGVKWDGTPTPMSWSIVALVLTMLFIPAYPGAPYDLRGNGEMYSLNGPSWSLFFEYIGNLLYALVIRRLSNRALAVLTTILGAAWCWFATTDVSGYDMIGIGWTLDKANFFGGLLRMMFPFSLGMLMARNFKPVKIKGIFWIAWAVLFALFSVPAFAKCGSVSINGVYEFACIFVRIPCYRMAYSLGRIDKQALLFILQIPGRHLLSALYRTLSGDVYVLRMVDREQTLHARRDLAGSNNGFCNQHCIGLRLLEALR